MCVFLLLNNGETKDPIKNLCTDKELEVPSLESLENVFLKFFSEWKCDKPEQLKRFSTY